MSNTRETISLKTIIMTQNITKRQGKRKGKDTCDAFFPLSFVPLFFSLSLSLVSLSSVLEDERKKKQKKRRKKAGDPRQRLMDLGSFFFFFFLEIATNNSSSSQEKRRTGQFRSADRFPHKEKKRKGRAENRSRDYIYI